MSILKYIPYFKRKRELDTNRAKGCMFGQSVGDALGLGSEFMCKTEVETYYPDGLTDYSQIWQVVIEDDGIKVIGQMTQI